MNRPERAFRKWLMPRLLGDWWSTELENQSGFPDMIGMVKGQVIFMELKIGAPRPSALRKSQTDFAWTCVRHEIEHWLAFRHRGEVVFRRNMEFAFPATPAFYWPGLPKAVRQRRRTRILPPTDSPAGTGSRRRPSRGSPSTPDS